MIGRRRTGVVLVALVLMFGGGCKESPDGAQRSGAASAWSKIPEPKVPTDHSTFFSSPLADGPAVTRACLACHPNAAQEVMQTAHWNWLGEEVRVPGRDAPVRIGKRNVINNFCIGIKSNWPGCTQCHIGYGWEDENFDFSDPSRVDCLVCHDNSGTYTKQVQGAGLPDPTVDLLVAARSVGLPRRANCGSCHFQGGGENAVKHGDLDLTLMFPSGRIDTHMGDHDMHCIDCHQSRQHKIKGRAMSVSVDRENRLRCTDCHAAQPHQDTRLNAHTARVACTACHIPFMAVDTGTKMSWDWSQAGQDLDISNSHLYLKIKGRFTWAKKMPPEYYWYNERASRYLLGDSIDPTKTTVISGPLGSRDDPDAQLWPFKVHRGKQVYDTVNNYFLLPNVHGEQGFWTRFDWPTALEIGSDVTGLPFSGLYDFAATSMYFPLAHMVTRAEQALQCRDCHGETGRLDWSALGYNSDPIGLPSLPHEAIYLFDAEGDAVVESGLPMSPTESCGACHELDDESFVQAHAYHSRIDIDLLEPERRSLMHDGPRIPVTDNAEMNCFLCHMPGPNLAERQRALESDRPQWSISATLIGSGLLSRNGEEYVWNTERIDEDGETEMDFGPVSESNCGACHGVVHAGLDPLLIRLGADGMDARWITEKTGQVFSPQRIRHSGLNLVGKDDLDLAWDVHAERVVSCGDCHYSKGRPARLSGELAERSPGTLGKSDRRRCESCHAVEGSHAWLEEKQRHLASVACEACHVPELEMAAQQQLDYTVWTPQGDPLIAYRGVVSGDLRSPSQVLIDGYRPLLRVGRSLDGGRQVLPYNLVSSWYWMDAQTGERISTAQLRQAWMDDEGYADAVMAVFDANADQRIDDQELRLDSEAKTAMIAARLLAVGVSRPQVRGEMRAYAIHHNIRHGDRIGRDCQACHPDNATAAAIEFPLASYIPGGVLPDLSTAGAGIELDGELVTTRDGGLVLRAARGAAASYQKDQERRE